MLEIDKWGSVLKGFSENQDTLGYTVHTPLYQDDWLPGAVYEWYAKDTSKKIKAVFKARMRDGKRVSGAVPYGYYRKPEDMKISL